MNNLTIISIEGLSTLGVIALMVTAYYSYQIQKVEKIYNKFKVAYMKANGMSSEDMEKIELMLEAVARNKSHVK